MKIALCGYYAKNNFGDDMMADCLSEVLSSSDIASNFLPDITFKNIVDNKNKTNKKLLNVFLNTPYSDHLQ